VRSKFITFEGSEACGKSTQLERLRARLASFGQEVVVTREPGGTPLGEMVRHLLKHAPEGRGMCSEAEILLFSASRAELVRKVIGPRLAKEAWVLSDRFYDSTMVYQGLARQLGMETVQWLNAFAVGQVHPGLTLILDLPLEEANRRLALRSLPLGQFDRMEEESREFYATVREGFRRLAEQEPDRVRLLDAQGTPEEVSERIWREVVDAFSI
jgi:dTMP kinase